jgi:hypothetical protein
VSGVGAVAIGGQLTPFSTTTGGARLRFGGGLAMALPTAGADTARGDWLHGGEPTRFAANTLAFHVHADARVDRGRLFAQAQLGAERAAPTDDRPGSGSWTFRSGVAAGVAVGFGVAALAELATTSAVSAGLRWHARSVTVAVRAYVPLDASLRSADVFAIGIDAAARF